MKSVVFFVIIVAGFLAQADGINCVPNCSLRDSSGQCVTYTSDFCGVNAKCIKQCTGRDAEFSCVSFGPDVCSRDRAPDNQPVNPRTRPN